MTFHRLPTRIAAVVAIVTSLAVGGCAPTKVDASVANVAPTDAPLGSVRKLAATAVPLPPGNWVELARTSTPAKYLDHSYNGVDLVEIGYGLIENGRLSVYLYVRTNSARIPLNHWAMTTYCTELAPRADPITFLQKVDSLLIDRQSCLKMTYAALDPPKSTNLYAQAWNAAQQYGGFPRDALDVYEEANFNGNFLVYSMFYFPERDGLPPGPWASGNLDPARQNYLRSLVGWAQGFQHWVIDGAKNAL